MILRFIKSNWFILAILLLVILAVFRKNLRFTTTGTPPLPAEVSREKYTDQSTGMASSSQMGLFEAGGEARSGAQLNENNAENFLRRFSQTAISEHKKFGIPASVMLAHACLSSAGGQAVFSKNANNFTGLTCCNGWDGPSITVSGQCYRQYKTPWESFRDFSIYLATQDWPASLRQKPATDWKSWVQAFDKHQLGAVPGYDKEMEKLILAFRLFELDK
jgi:hypothetical protein